MGMFSKNLKYYRLKNNMTKATLAEKIGVSPMAITHYENGDRQPDMTIIKKLGSALGVRVVDFLAVRNQNLNFVHGKFRKNHQLSLAEQAYVCEAVEEYFSRFYDAVEILGGSVLKDFPKPHSLVLSKNMEENGLKLRDYLSISASGPVSYLIQLLENRGILVFLLAFENEYFAGMSGTVNERPYIVVNKNLTPEQIRSTIGHELAHIAFDWSMYEDDKNAEKFATLISGSFLFPKDDVTRELGYKRKHITTDMLMVCREYGITISMLVLRALHCNVISENTYRQFFSQYSPYKNGYRILFEEPTLFEQLVYRAVNEEEISIQKGAELLKMPYESVEQHCRLLETGNAIYK